jgi:hypothetical protein
MADIVRRFADDPAIAGLVLVYLSGVVTGWQLARRTVRYMLGGRL